MWQGMNVFFLKLLKKFPVVAFDLSAIIVSWYLAHWLRYNMYLAPEDLTNVYTLASLGVLVVVQTACYYYFKVYRGLWRFFSINDVGRIIKATLTATGIAVLSLYFCSLLNYIPRSVFPVYDLILVTFLCGGRLLMRFYWDHEAQNNVEGKKQRVLIIGAGRAGESLVRDLKYITGTYILVGLVDDDVKKKGLEVHGVCVLGSIQELPELVKKFKIDLLFIAIASAGSATMRRIVSYCEDCKVSFRTLPGLPALLEGRVEVNALRKVNIEDLLGRDEIQLEWDKITSYIRHKRVVVTGGGGSIGSELCRQVLKLNPKKLLIIDSSEFNLYQIEYELKKSAPNCEIQLGLISVTDATAVDFIFHHFKPQIVFHAAAYKHVPLLEDQIRVAVQNNVMGTQVIAEASVSVGVEKFILISTDKAVNPTNVMGTTKRVAEIYCQNLNARVDTQFITVRFGNVLGSAGSVVPLFQKQLLSGGPLTVTHPDVTRYFMTIPEASQLILQAMMNGSGGEIFVLDMGEPIKISYLAEQMIRLAGKQAGTDIMIEYTGLRPGEKLFEELFHASEQLVPTAHEKLFKAKFRELEWNELTQVIRLLNKACVMHNDGELYVLLKSLVPEFNTQIEPKQILI